MKKITRRTVSRPIIVQNNGGMTNITQTNISPKIEVSDLLGIGRVVEEVLSWIKAR